MAVVATMAARNIPAHTYQGAWTTMATSGATHKTPRNTNCRNVQSANQPRGCSGSGGGADIAS
jgi:hypothetical protein